MLDDAGSASPPLVEATASAMDAGNKMESGIDFSIFRFGTTFAIWNCRALFGSCFMSRKQAVLKMGMFKKLCVRYPVVLLQETRGTACDVDTVSTEVATHVHHLSVMDRLAGGVMVSVSKAYLSKFGAVIAQEIEPG